MKKWKWLSAVVIVLLLMVLPLQAHAEENAAHDQLRQEIRTALLNRESNLSVEQYNISPEELVTLFLQTRAEPDFWYVSPFFHCSSDGDTVAWLDFFYQVDTQHYQPLRDAVQQAIDECIHSGMSDVQKALALHDYLVLHCAYDTNYLNYKPYDALVLGSSVCQGYAEAYQILLHAVGIESMVVISEAMNHAWNVVKIDGQWYHVDVTWDDPLFYYSGQDVPGYVRHNYFLCSDAEIQRLQHYGWKSYGWGILGDEPEIACTSTTYDGDMFWDESDSAIWFLSDKEVLMRRDTVGSMEVFIKNLQTGTETSLYADIDKCFAYDGYWFSAINYGLSFEDGDVYFSDLTNVYRMSDLSGTPEVICTLEELAEGHYIYSTYVDGITLYAVVVNDDTDTAQTVTKLLDQNHVHTWMDGVVTVEPTEYSRGEICYTCSGCGLVYRQTLEKLEHVHSYSQTITVPTCTGSGFTYFFCRCGDSYEADFVAPLGHSWNPANCSLPKMCTRCYITEGSVTDHTWSAATCTEPKRCTVCGTIEGSANGHTWRQASCDKPKTCTTCGAIEGRAMGHNWQDATCDKPMICTRCKASSGRPAGHRYDNGWDGTCNGCGVHRETTEKRTVMHMFRMYDPNSGEHFYTGSEAERDFLVSVGWNYEGVGFTFSRTTGMPVYRLYDPVYGEHLYTMDEAERDALIAQGWNIEGVAFNSAYDTEVPQYRLHNPNAKRGAYHFTASEAERDMLIALGWEYQGIGFYSSWK